MKKSGKIVLFAAVLAVLGGGITSFADTWKKDAKGDCYQKDDGSYASSEWIADHGKWYYIGDNGYMISNAWVGNYYVGDDGSMLTNMTTPDGHYVGADGMWIEGGQAEVQDNQYLDAYAAFLRSYKIPKGKNSINSIKPRFHLLYIDGDKIPELVISEDSIHASSIDLYAYNQGVVHKIGSFGSFGSFSYVQGANLFCSAYAGSGSEFVTFYTLQDNMAVPLIQFNAYDSNSDYLYDECNINNIPVTETDYNNQYTVWDAVFTPISYAGYREGYEVNETNIIKMLENIQNVMPKQ